MQQIYTNVTKVVVDSKQGSNLMYLPLDKLMQMTASGAPLTAPAQEPSNATVQSPASTSGATADPRSRESLRSRDRDAR
jgi:membrane protease subunit HflK